MAPPVQRLSKPAYILAALALAGCDSLPTPAPTSPEAALSLYYDSIPDSALPVAPIGKPMPAADQPLTRILIGSCHDEEQSDPLMSHLATEAADMVLLIGDNVYGDRDGPAYVNNDPDLTELREAYTDLAASDEFKALRSAHPIMVAWDDHDYGANDAGRNFPFRALSERIHERFWGLAETEAARHNGTYYAQSFGPEGQRVQVIMLDTRFFRSDLTQTDDWGAPGKERYLPSSAKGQDMLGNAQWQWLSDRLSQPADLRLIVSSVQVLPTSHGWEAWATLPQERARLFNTIRASAAEGVVFLSGDRHTGFVYRDDTALDYPALELTSSSLNVSFAEISEETDPRQIGAGYAPENFGDITIDWAKGELGLQLRDKNGNTVRSTTIPIGELTP